MTKLWSNQHKRLIFLIDWSTPSRISDSSGEATVNWVAQGDDVKQNLLDTHVRSGSKAFLINFLLIVQYNRYSMLPVLIFPRFQVFSGFSIILFLYGKIKFLSLYILVSRVFNIFFFTETTGRIELSCFFFRLFSFFHLIYENLYTVFFKTWGRFCAGCCQWRNLCVGRQMLHHRGERQSATLGTNVSQPTGE